MGEGEAVLLNFNVYPHYPRNNDSRFSKEDWRKEKRALGLLELLAQQFRDAGASPKIDLVDEAGNAVRDVRRVQFRGPDGARMLGLLRDVTADVPRDEHAASARQLWAVLPEHYYAYDMLSGQKLGRTRKLAAALGPGRPALFALLEDEPRPVTVELGSPQAKPGEPIEATIATSLPNALVLVQVFDDAGTPLRWFRRLLRTDTNGAAVAKLPLAHNERPGNCRLVVDEVVTCRTVAATFTIGEAR